MMKPVIMATALVFLAFTAKILFAAPGILNEVPDGSWTVIKVTNSTGHEDFYKTWTVVKVTESKITLERTKRNGATAAVTIDRSRRPYLRVGCQVRYDSIRNRLRKTLPGCDELTRPDPAEGPAGRIVETDAQLPLGSTEFIARISSFNNPDTNPEGETPETIYALEVIRKFLNTYDVLFGRYLDLEELPEGIESRNIEDIVTYDSNTRVVIFTVGERQYTYTLPEN